MTTKIVQSEELGASQREKFCALVGVGVPRRHAAVNLGVSPSTVSRRMAADPQFAERVREAETECELQLMQRVMLQSERSWRACVWLLERVRPERYARGKQPAGGPSASQLFDQFVGLIDREVADAALRERLTHRLDEMILEELMEEAALEERPPLALGASAAQSPSARPKQPPSQRPSAAGPTPAGRIAELLAHGKPGKPGKGQVPDFCNTSPPIPSPQPPVPGPKAPVADFCNTSPDVHERRSLDKVCS